MSLARPDFPADPQAAAAPPAVQRWHSFANAETLADAALAAILAAARAAIEARQAFHIVLAGGTTPKRIYAALADAAADWRRWHVYFGDERCLPADDEERNSRMAAQAWLGRVAIPAHQVHPIAAERGATVAAAQYCNQLAAVELFDLVLLGLGEDGHTASLFPGKIDATDGRAALPVSGAPKPPAERVTLSARRLSAARQVMFLVTGMAKLEAVRAWRRGDAIPAAAIRPETGVDIYLEAQLAQA